MPPWRCLIVLSCSSGSRISPSIPRQPHQESSNSVRNFCVWLLLLLLPRCPWLRFSSFILSVLRFRQQIEIEMLPQNRETATTAAIATAAATASGNGRSCNALHTHTETHKQANTKANEKFHGSQGSCSWSMPIAGRHCGGLLQLRSFCHASLNICNRR